MAMEGLEAGMHDYISADEENLSEFALLPSAVDPTSRSSRHSSVEHVRTGSDDVSSRRLMASLATPGHPVGISGDQFSPRELRSSHGESTSSIGMTSESLHPRQVQALAKDTDWYRKWNTAPTRSGISSPSSFQSDTARSRSSSTQSPPPLADDGHGTSRLLSFERSAIPIPVPVATATHCPQPQVSVGDKSVQDGVGSDVYPPLVPEPALTPVVLSNSAGSQRKSHDWSESPPGREVVTSGSVSPSVFADFLHHQACHSLMPDNSKVVVFDSQLSVKKAFFALVQNGVRSAPVFDSLLQAFTGMLTITDFINILRHYYRSPLVQMDELEEHKIQTWRDLAIRQRHGSLVSIDPQQSLYDAVVTLIENKIHRLPVIDSHIGNVLYILTPKKLLQFLFSQFEEAPQPKFMAEPVRQLGVGTFDSTAMVSQETPLIVVLNIFAERRISAVPVVSEQGVVVDIYAKFDVINLAAERTYDNLDISVQEALSHRAEGFEGVHTCLGSESLQTVVRRLVEKQVHRLVVVDSRSHVVGIVSLSDVLRFLVLKAPRLLS